MKELDEKYKIIYNEIMNEVKRFEGKEMTPKLRKEIGLYIADPRNCVKHKGAFFPWLFKNSERVEKYIRQLIEQAGEDS